jgi:hypothetical protein
MAKLKTVDEMFKGRHFDRDVVPMRCVTDIVLTEPGDNGRL